MTSFMLAAIQIDIDITVVFQAIIFFFVVVLLNNIIIQPYLDARQAREESTDGSREGAEEQHARADQLSSAYDEGMLLARRDAVAVSDDLRGQGTSEQQDMVGEVQIELDANLAAERAEIAKMVADAESQIEARASALSALIVQKVMPQAGV